jgi:hypothetical protein
MSDYSRMSEIRVTFDGCPDTTPLDWRDSASVYNLTTAAWKQHIPRSAS